MRSKGNGWYRPAQPWNVRRSVRCLANLAHIRQSRLDSGLGLQVKIPSCSLLAGLTPSRFHSKSKVFRRNVRRFRGGLVFKAHRLWHHSTLGSRVIKKRKRTVAFGTRGHGQDVGAGVGLRHAHPTHDLACHHSTLPQPNSPARRLPALAQDKLTPAYFPASSVHNPTSAQSAAAGQPRNNLASTRRLFTPRTSM